MKRFISCLLAVALLLTLAMPVAMAADERTSGAFTYRIKGNGTAAITGYDWASMAGQDIFIPRMLDGYTVTEIAEEAFADISYDETGCPIYKSSGRNKAQSLVIPDTIISIGDKAFFGIELVSYSITIPSSVQYIGAGAFSNIEGLEQFVVNNNSVYAVIDGILYHKAEKKLIAYPKDFQGTPYELDGYSAIDRCTAIPYGIKEIADYAFFGVEHEKNHSTIFCDTLEVIGDYAFASAKFVNHYPVLLDEEYEEYVYEGTLTLPPNVTKIGVGAFRGAGCSWFSDNNYGYIYLHETKIQDIPAYAFEGVTIDEGLTLPTELKTIGERAFANSSIRYTYTLTMPASVEYIGTEAFADFCTGHIRNCTIAFSSESKLIEIAEGAFDGARIFNKTLSLPKGLKTIGDNAFRNMDSLEELVIPASVNRIGNSICPRESVLISTEAGSYAAVWAAENGYITQSAGGEDTSWLND